MVIKMIKKLIFIFSMIVSGFSLYSITFFIPLDATGDSAREQQGDTTADLVISEPVFEDDLTGDPATDRSAESTDSTVDIVLDHKTRESTPEQKFLAIKAVFDIGFGISGTASDRSGINDLETFFFRPAFHIQDFGIGFSIALSFRVFPERFIFQSEKWYVEGDTGRTAFALLDKIDYISYGDKDHFIHTSTGKVSFTSLGTGLLMNNFHNSFFHPIDRENGLFFTFDGRKFKKYKLPLRIKFLTPDILDFDIFGLETNFDILEFLKYKDVNLSLGAAAAFDLDGDESNTLSADTINSAEYYRNNRFSSIIAGFSFPVVFTLTRQHVRFIVNQELGFLFTDPAAAGSITQFGLAEKIGTETQVANIKNSGYLLGLKAGFIFRYDNFDLNYFSSNYQIVRRRQVNYTLDSLNIYVDAGLAFYALQEKLQFNLQITFPLILQNNFKSKIQASFIYDGRQVQAFIPGLYVAAHFENDMDIMSFSGNGGPFLETFTRGFRYSFEIGYRVFCAKMTFLIGVQRPNWINENSYIDLNTNLFNTDQYGKDLQKFIAVEVSFVL